MITEGARLISQPQNLGLTNYRIRVASHCNGICVCVCVCACAHVCLCICHILKITIKLQQSPLLDENNVLAYDNSLPNETYDESLFKTRGNEKERTPL